MRVVLRAPEPLVRLLASIDGVAQVIAPDDPLPPHDAWLPLLSVAGALGADATSIPSDVPYLRADAQRRANAARIVSSHSRRLNVGLAWAGNPDQANNRRRSMPLAALAPLFELPDVGWFSLQKGDAANQIATVPAARALVPLAADNELDDTAALIAELDLVITVCTSIAHLSGALGKPTWVMLAFAADWRWGLNRSDSAWYPTTRLFRQAAIGDWASVLREVARALHAKWDQVKFRAGNQNANSS
jgi:hypothetical protein